MHKAGNTIYAAVCSTCIVCIGIQCQIIRIPYKAENDFPEYENDPVLDSMALYIYSLMCSDAELIHDTVTHMDMIMEKKPDCWQTALCLLLMKKDITASDRHEFAKEQLKYHGNLTAGMIQEALAFNLNPQLFKLGQSELFADALYLPS